MLAAHRAVYHGGSRPLGYGSCRADVYGTVDDRQTGLEEFDVSGCLPDEVCDPEGIADMQNVDVLRGMPGRIEIHPKRLVKLGSKLKQWLADFAEACYDNRVTLFHVSSFRGISQLLV
jgi:hypothetical protein